MRCAATSARSTDDFRETGSVWQEIKTSATGSPYRWASLAVDRNFGKTWLSAGISNLNEKQTLLGGRMGNALGGGGANTVFLDLEARRELGGGWSASLSGRRGWTSFAGGQFETGAYGFDVTKIGLLGEGDRLGFRLSQPLRIERGGFAMLLPTAYDYGTLTATNSLVKHSLAPTGREVDAELTWLERVRHSGLGRRQFVHARNPGIFSTADNDYGAVPPRSALRSDFNPGL